MLTDWNAARLCQKSIVFDLIVINFKVALLSPFNSSYPKVLLSLSSPCYTQVTSAIPSYLVLSTGNPYYPKVTHAI